MWFFKCDQKEKRKRRTERTAALEKRLVSYIRKQFDDDEEQGPSICGRYTGVVILRYTLSKTPSRPRMTPFNIKTGRKVNLGLRDLHRVRHVKYISHYRKGITLINVVHSALPSEVDYSEQEAADEGRIQTDHEDASTIGSWC